MWPSSSLTEGTVFKHSAHLYDQIYAFKDYRAESETLMDLVCRDLRSGGRCLLDVACGTGLHLQFLRAEFDVEGLDLDSELLEIARQRLPGIPLHQGDMTGFDLGRQFDVVTCLFSSIGYVRTLDNLYKAMGTMAAHLLPGGLLLVEPWFTPAEWKPDTVHSLFIDEPELKIARINTSQADGRLSYMDFHYLVGTPEGVEHFVERHELGLFEREEMIDAFRAAGLGVTYDPKGLMGRGLYIGRRDLDGSPD
jgi:SAM-dependent methyltransferase